MALYERWIRVVVIGQKADEKNAINMAQVIRMERDTNKNETKLFFSDGSDIKVKPSMSKLTEDLEDGGL